MNKKSKKYFFISMISTLFVLALITGFIVVEKNARAIMLEDSSPFLVYKQKNFLPELVKIHFMGKDFVFNF